MSPLSVHALSVSYLALEAVLVAGIALALFRLRKRYGLGLLYVFVGSNQFFSSVVASSIYFEVADGVSVSPGSVVIFASTLFAVFLVYLREDIPQTRTMIYGVALATVSLTLLSWLTVVQIKTLPFDNLLGLPMEVFTVHPRVFVAGTATLVLDAFLLIVVYELLGRRLPRLPNAVRIVAAMVLLLTLDGVVFTSAAFAGHPAFRSVLVGQLVGKAVSGVLFGLCLAAYLRLVEPESGELTRGTASGGFDPFAILTYRERYEEVKRRLAEAEAANLAKSRFLAHMSHELRTPLTSIIGFTDVLLKNRGDASRANLDRFLKRIHENGRHLLMLINGLLDLSRIEAGRIELVYTEFSLTELVKETLERLQGQALGKDLTLTADLPAGAASLHADRARLRQVLINLIGNAIKFTDEGEIRVRLLAGGHGAGGPERIDVVDTGIGVPPEKLDLIFEAFEQADSGDGRAYGGTGLGLAISRALCEKMGYRLEVSSRPGAGSTFSVVFSPRG